MGGFDVREGVGVRGGGGGAVGGLGGGLVEGLTGGRGAERRVVGGLPS